MLLALYFDRYANEIVYVLGDAGANYLVVCSRYLIALQLQTQKVLRLNDIGDLLC